MAIHLGRSLPNASRDRPERRRGRPARRRRPKPTPPAAPTWSCSRWGLPCRRRCRRRGALLPHHFTLAARRPEGRNGFGGVFLWHFPWGRPRRALPGTVPPWSPDFPPSPLALDRGEERPSDRLAGIIWDAAPLLSNQDRRAGDRSRRGLPHQRDKAAHRRRALAAPAGQVQRRDQPGIAGERPVGHPLYPHSLHRGRDQRHAEPGRDEA
jgi:hypothetical protein